MDLRFAMASDRGFSPALAQALILASQRLERWFSNAAAFHALLHEVYGADAGRAETLRQALPADGLRFELQLLAGPAMGGALGGHAPGGPSGAGSIFLNRSWLASASAPQIEAVLLEEVGHALDHRLNGSDDTAGDEGA